MKMDARENVFVFHTSLELVKAADYSARNLRELLEALQNIEGSSIFYHTHRFFRESLKTGGGYSSDYAQWAADALREPRLAAEFTAIEMHKLRSIEAVRNALTAVIKNGSVKAAG